MAHETYIGVNNIAQNVNKIWIGDNGVAKKVKRGYIGDANGIARLFFSSEYKWNRYTLRIQYRWNKSTIGYGEVRSFGQDIQLYLTNSYIQYVRSATKPAVQTHNGEYVYNLPLNYRGDSSWSSQYWVGEVQYTKSIYNGSDLSVKHGLLHNRSGNITVYTIKDSAGTFIEYVYSDNNPSAYPNGGVLDDYYYSNRIENSYSQGDFDSVITSENENAYPDNGKQGNYWYVKI